MYGSQLWDMESEKADAMLTQWRIAHRIILGIPYDAHIDILPLIANNMPLKCILDCKFISFYKAISASENKMVNIWLRLDYIRAVQHLVEIWDVYYGHMN